MKGRVLQSEQDRLQALHDLGILDTPPDERFDRLTRLASKLFDAPIALVSLVDSDRQWFKSRVGWELTETERAISFCARAILGDGVMVVPDASRDERFSDNPLVVGSPNIRFYAGCPVRAPDGSNLGTLCVIDQEPRDIEDDDEEVLRDLAEMVETELRAVQLATVDDLTGLMNRRGFNAIAYHTLALCQRMEKPAALLMFDLNDFKEINDTRGHAEGDRALRRFAAHLSRSFRGSDVVARIGGDEFCVLVSGSTERDAERPLEEHLRRRHDRPQRRTVLADVLGVGVLVEVEEDEKAGVGGALDGVVDAREIGLVVVALRRLDAAPVDRQAQQVEAELAHTNAVGRGQRRDLLEGDAAVVEGDVEDTVDPGVDAAEERDATVLVAQVDADCIGDAGLLMETDMSNCEEMSGGDIQMIQNWLSLMGQCGWGSAIEDAIANDRFFWFDRLGDRVGIHRGEEGLASERNRIYFDRDYWYSENEVELIAHSFPDRKTVRLDHHTAPNG